LGLFDNLREKEEQEVLAITLLTERTNETRQRNYFGQADRNLSDPVGEGRGNRRDVGGERTAVRKNHREVLESIFFILFPVKLADWRWGAATILKKKGKIPQACSRLSKENRETPTRHRREELIHRKIQFEVRSPALETSTDDQQGRGRANCLRLMMGEI